MTEHVRTTFDVHLNENAEINKDKKRVPIKYSRGHKHFNSEGRHSTKRAISVININQKTSEPKCSTAQKPCVLRQKSAPSCYGSRRYLPKTKYRPNLQATKQPVTNKTFISYILLHHCVGCFCSGFSGPHHISQSSMK